MQLIKSIVICVGSGSESAAAAAAYWSRKNGLLFKGLLERGMTPVDGCYHTSIYDIDLAYIGDLVRQDAAVLLSLDEPPSKYGDIDDYELTMLMITGLYYTGRVLHLNPAQKFETIELMQQSRSFCLMPYTSAMFAHDTIEPCCAAIPDVSHDRNLFDYASDGRFELLRKNMLDGIIDKKCESCVSVEKHGMHSPRMVWTAEIAIKTGLRKLGNLVPKVVNYDIRLGNNCNLMCRTCSPSSSKLIDREYIHIGLADQQVGQRAHAYFDVVDFSSDMRVYVAGGEPTIDEQMTDFMERCVTRGKTDFDLVINTNAASLSGKFLSLAEKFSRIKFEISVDGYKDVNTYIRWPTQWEKLELNIKKLSDVSNGRISFNTVVSVYNVAVLADLVQYLEDNYPTAKKHLSILHNPVNQLPVLFPDSSAVLSNVDRIKGMATYSNCGDFRSKVDGLVDMFLNRAYDHAAYLAFRDWNSKLDKSRGVDIEEYIPIFKYAKTN